MTYMPDPSPFGPASSPIVRHHSSLLQYGCATLTLGTLGSVSDYHGRRVIMALSLLGQLFQTALVLLTVVVPRLSYTAIMYLIYAGTAVTGLTGSYGAFLMVSSHFIMATTTRARHTSKQTMCPSLSLTSSPPYAALS